MINFDVVRQLRKNVVLMWVSSALTIIVSFYLTPFMIDSLGKETYGLWALASSIMSYSAFFNMGMNQAIMKYVSQEYATKQIVRLNQVVNSAAVLFSIIAILFLIFIFVVSNSLESFFDISETSITLLISIVLVFGFQRVLMLVLLPWTGLGPYHRSDILAIFGIGVVILRTTGIVMVLTLGYGLYQVVIVIASIETIILLVQLVVRKKLVPEVLLRVSLVSWDAMKNLLSYGRTSFVVVISYVFIFNIDNIVIGKYLSLDQVAVYAVPASIITQLRASVNIIATPLVATISHLNSTGRDTEAYDIYLKLVGYTYYFSGFAVSGLIVFGPKFLDLWVGEGFSESHAIIIVLAASSLFFLPSSIANSMLFAYNRQKLLAYLLWSEAVLNVVLSLLLVQSYGILGVAFGTAIPQFFLHGIVYPLLFSRKMEYPLLKLLKRAARCTAQSIGATVPISILFLHFAEIQNWGGFILEVVVVSIIAVLVFWRFTLSKDERTSLISRKK